MGKKAQYESEVEEEEDQDISEMDEEEEDDEEEYQSNSDLIEEDSDAEGSDDGRGDGFGAKRDGYHKGSDVTDSDDSGEEHGAEEVYHENQRILSEADFIDVDFANDAREKVNDEDDLAKDGVDAAAEERDRKEKLIKKLSPEIMSLARELKTSMKEINEKLLPLLEINEAKRILQQKGGNYLEVRYELLLSYTICILFYLVLKAKGKVTNNHPVLDALTKYKTYFERMNVSLDGFYAQATMVLKKSLKSEKKQVAALSFEEKMKQMAQQKKKGAASQSQKDARKLQEELKQLQGFGSSSEDNEYDMSDEDDDDEMSEDDEDIRITKGARAAVAAAPKKDKKKEAKKNTDEIDMSSIDPWLLNDDEEDDGDTMFAAPKKVDLNKQKQQQQKNKKGNAEPAGGYEDAFYKKAKEDSKTAVLSKKAQRVQDKVAKKELLQKKYEVAEIGDAASRKITPQILHNKGTLIRKRNKIDGNAKLKNRMKYERKLKIHNRNGGKIYEEKKQYFGELGAIKSSLVKSTKL